MKLYIVMSIIPKVHHLSFDHCLGGCIEILILFKNAVKNLRAERDKSKTSKNGFRKVYIDSNK